MYKVQDLDSAFLERDIKAHFGNFLYLMKTCNWFNK